MRQIWAENGILVYNSGSAHYFVIIFCIISYFDKLLQITIHSLVKQSLLLWNFGWGKFGPKMAFFLYNSGCAQYFLAIFGMISYFDKLLQMTIQSNSLFYVAILGKWGNFGQKIALYSWRPAQYFPNIFYMISYFGWLLQMTMQSLVFIVLKFWVIEANLDHKLHFLCITQDLLKVL